MFPSCPWVALLGLDGSGKSSVIEKLEETTVFEGVFVLHRRPQLVYHTAVASQPGQIEHYQKPPHNAWRSAVKLAAMWLDWLAGYWLTIYPRRVRGVLVVADRHSLLDLQADPLRYRYGGSPGWVRLATRLLPMPDAVLLLDAPTAVLQARKQELTAEKAAELRHNYLRLVQKYDRSYVIDASRPLSQVVANVQQILSEISR
ncbi:MAG: hypothetical protein KC441_04205 [Anaerolineales bacterium]|nr:hypothetical protein [Anaerolineales bacterium]